MMTRSERSIVLAAIRREIKRLHTVWDRFTDSGRPYAAEDTQREISVLKHWSSRLKKERVDD